MLLLILILAASATGQVPTYQLETILPAPGCTSVDLSPDGTKLCARMQYGGWDEGYRVFDAETYAILNDCGGHWAPWRGLVSADSAYLYTTLYYRGCVAKIELSTCAEPTCIPVGPWPLGLAFDSQRRYLYVGVNCPGRGVIGSLKVIDTNTDQVVGSVPLNGEPGYMVLDPCDEFVYLVSRIRVPETLYKIRTSDYGVEATLAVPGVDEPCISVSPDCATVYVPYPGADLVYKIDTATLNDGGSWSIDSPHGFFVSPDGTHALITGHSDPKIQVFDLLTETVVQTITIPDIGTYYSPSKSTIYWDGNNGKVYINLCATEGGVAVLVPEPAVEAAVDIDPDVLNLKSRGKWITCYIWLPEPYDVADVDPDTILLNGEIYPAWSWIDEAEQMLMAKFPRSAAQEMLEPGEVELTVSGELADGTKFEGSDTIRVIDKGAEK